MTIMTTTQLYILVCARHMTFMYHVALKERSVMLFHIRDFVVVLFEGHLVIFTRLKQGAGY